MSPELLALLKPLVDTQPVYNLMPAVVNPEMVTPEARAFARSKLEEAVKTLRATATWIEKRLREVDEMASIEESKR